MSRKSKPAKKPVNFYQWLRSGLRSLSRKWPPVYAALAAAKVPYVGDNKRRQWSYKCAMCSGLFEGKQVTIDHRLPAGKLSSKEDIADFVGKLFCAESGLQCLCKSCHDAKTLGEKLGCTLDEARLQKDIIAICKRPVSEVVQFCTDYGYTAAQCSNGVKRRKIVEEILKAAK